MENGQKLDKMEEMQAALDRRDFLKSSAAVAGGVLALQSAAFAANNSVNEEIRVGLIGCGGRGRGAAKNAENANPQVRIVAGADVFQDRINDFRKFFPNVTEDHCFVGFDGYQKLLALDLDYVILATPPYFRPEHLRAAVNAGKNVFTEKPVAVDPVGCRSVMESGRLAAEKKLSIVAGTQRRHQAPYVEMIEQLRNGAIGQLVAARCYWCGGQLWYKQRQSGWSDMEWMLRDWVNWSWLSGDHIVEQHVHNIDVINWMMDSHPIKADGYGARHRRPTGDQFDFFSVDFEYPNGVHLSSYCRQINGCTNDVAEYAVGEKGTVSSNGSGNCKITGPNEWAYNTRRQRYTDPYVQEHIDLIDSILNNKGLNEAETVATSTLSAIMGRIAAYTGKEVNWVDMMKSDLRLGPPEVNWELALLSAEIPVPGSA